MAGGAQLSPETSDFSQELISQPAPFVGETYSFTINNLGMLVKRSIDHKRASLFSTVPLIYMTNFVGWYCL